MDNKREVAVLLPYKIEGSVVRVFLQKRGMESKVLPGHFSFFGGKLEKGEKPEEALRREIKEELDFTIKEHSFLGTYTSAVDVLVVLHVYITKVSSDFENTIEIHEGEYGKFFSEEEIMNEPMLIESDKNILKDFRKIVVQRHGK